jgi:hypothetical protein
LNSTTAFRARPRAPSGTVRDSLHIIDVIFGLDGDEFRPHRRYVLTSSPEYPG